MISRAVVGSDRRAPTYQARGAPVPPLGAYHIQAMLGALAVFPGLRPASLPTATTCDCGCLSLFATIRQEVLRVSGDPDVGQQPLQVHLVQRQGYNKYILILQ